MPRKGNDKIEVFWNSSGEVILSRTDEKGRVRKVILSPDQAFRLAKELLECASNASTTLKMKQVDIDKEKRVTVGRCDGTGDTNSFYTPEEASAFIQNVLAVTDPEGVHQGEYYIDVPNRPRKSTS